MATHKKPYLKALIFGVISITSYIILFQNVELVMDNFTRGGIYAALPVGSVFYFSFLHGAFASNVLEVVGLQAKKKK
jgi:TRAP-type C4-dicarboxylate transport system permease small subunit